MILRRLFRTSSPINEKPPSDLEPVLKTELAPLHPVSFIDEIVASSWVGLHYRHEFLLHHKHELLEHRHAVYRTKA
jgi:hypothetical protein